MITEFVKMKVLDVELLDKEKVKIHPSMRVKDSNIYRLSGIRKIEGKKPKMASFVIAVPKFDEEFFKECTMNDGKKSKYVCMFLDRSLFSPSCRLNQICKYDNIVHKKMAKMFAMR